MDITGASNQELNESRSRFEAAVGAQAVDIRKPDVQRVVLALDGSNQDAPAQRYAAMICLQTGASLAVAFAYEGPEDDGKEKYRVDVESEIAASGIAVIPAIARPNGSKRYRSYDQLLIACDHYQAQLIVVPAPYGDDFAELGTRSVGTNLDMLMSRSTATLLVVRDPQRVSQAVRQVVMPVTPYHPNLPIAAGWAMLLVSDEGVLDLPAVIDPGVLQAAGLTPETELTPDQFAGLTEPAQAGLIGALQRQAAERGVGCRVKLRAGEPADEILKVEGDEGRLYVISTPRAPRATAYQIAQAVVRASADPVLIV
jgi:hypothetical protein